MYSGPIAHLPVPNVHLPQSRLICSNHPFHSQVLLLTIKRSLSDICRFLICAVVLFLAFSLFGWITFGPYHVKFVTFFSSLECLFALVNGDDIFTTFALIPSTTNTYIYVVSRIYLYSFLSLFIYIVLNVCISIILEAYETVTRRGTSQPPNSRMWAFIAECADPANSLAYRNDAGMRKRRLSTAASAADLAGWLSRWFQASLVSRVNNNNNKTNNPTAAADVDLVIEQDDGERPTFIVGGNNGAGGGGEARRAVSNRRRRSRRRLRRRGV
uniref:PKD_channel domain-containing protein n=1 Tax=Macrostomum lignano TaxID=282301 RepID=A0A1I8GUW1_9PLAT